MRQSHYTLLNKLFIILLSGFFTNNATAQESWYPLDVGYKWSFYYGANDTYISDVVVINAVDTIRYNSNLFYKLEMKFYFDTNSNPVPESVNLIKASDSLYTFERYDTERNEVWVLNYAIHTTDTLHSYWGPDSLFINSDLEEVLITKFPDESQSSPYLGRRLATFSDTSISDPEKYFSYEYFELMANSQIVRITYSANTDLNYNHNYSYSLIKGLGPFDLPPFFIGHNDSIESKHFGSLLYYKATLGPEKFEFYTSNEQNNQSPIYFNLNAYPNPFNPITNIIIDINESDIFTLSVYDILGNKLDTIHKGRMNKGKHSFIFNGSKLASGTYLIELKSGSIRITKKLTLLK